MSENWWKSAIDREILEWQKEWGTILKRHTASGINSSAFYVNRVRGARDLQSRLLREVSDAVNNSATACSHSSEIGDPSAIAREVLNPLNMKAREAIAAQPRGAAARGLTPAMVPTEKDLGLVNAEYDACRGALETSLRQRRAQLETTESTAEEGRSERTRDRAARMEKDRIDLYLRVLQILAVIPAAFGFKGAAVASAIVGVGALLFHENKRDLGF